jgi:hypothetical protein
MKLTQIIDNYFKTGNLEIGTDIEFFYIGNRSAHFIPGDIYRVVSITNLNIPHIHVRDRRGDIVILSLKGFLELFVTKSEFRDNQIDKIL